MRRGTIALVAITFLAYLPTLGAGFIWDDDSYVEQNLTLRSAAGLWRIWTDPSATPQYYPLVHTTFWVEAHLWSVHSAVPFHVFNVLLQAISAVVLWRLLCRLLDDDGNANAATNGIRTTRPASAKPVALDYRIGVGPRDRKALHPTGSSIAWLAAAVWAVHPVQVESVAWVTERKNVLSGLFYLLAATVLLMDGTPKPRMYIRGSHYAAAFCLFMLALLSKTTAASLPAAALLVLWWRRGRLAWRDVWPLLPFFAVGLAMGSFTAHLERTHVGASGPEFAFSPAQRVLIAGRAVWFYAAKLAVPWPLSFIYPRWTIDAGQAWQWAFPVGVVVVVIVALWLLRRRIGRGPLTGVLFFVGTLFPALGFANVLPMRYSFVADHFQYLACLGLIVPAATLLGRSRSASVAVVAACVVLTLCRCTVFADRVTLWTDTVQKNPSSWMVHASLAKALAAANRPAEASAEVRAELAAAPDLPDALVDAAADEARNGHFDQAMRESARATAAGPDYPPAWVQRAELLAHAGDLAGAEGAARRAVAIAPAFVPAHDVLARVLLLRHDPAAAAEFTRLGDLFLNGHLPAAAAGAYQRALAIDPASVRARAGLRRATAD
jgi:hypothetical protein